LLFALTGMVGGYFGAGLTHLLPPSVLMLMFAGLMLMVGGAMLRVRREIGVKGECRPLRCLAIGAAVGVLTGFLGVGGGFLIVPVLILFAGLDVPKAVGTSLAIIGLNSLSSLAGQLRHTSLDWQVVFQFLAAALTGMSAGLALSGKFADQTLKKLFAWLVIGVATAVLATTTASFLLD
jgi:uncharacterized membrane protein YfcA